MKQIKAILTGLLAAASVAATCSHAATILSESFETDGEGTRYTSNLEFRDATTTYFMRANNQQNSGQNVPNGTTAGDDDRRYSINGGSFTTYTNLDGTWVWAAENVDAGSPNPASVTLNTVNVSLYTNLVFRGLFGATVADTADFMRLSYSLGGGSYVQALFFATTNTGNTQGIALDTDNNGRGDPGAGGTNLLSEVLKEFSFSIPNTNTVQIKIEVFADASADEFGFDFFRITGDSLIPEPSSLALLGLGMTILWYRRTRN